MLIADSAALKKKGAEGFTVSHKMPAITLAGRTVIPTAV